MRNPVALLLLLLALPGFLAAQSLAARPARSVPATLEVAGLHLVLNEDARRLVQQKVDGLSRHQPSFQARVDLADAAFPIIDRVLREEGVPFDFRYLALQESALQGNARSTSEAVGYWQLKRETATGLGLVVNDAVDERQHLTSSTRAAARYLTRNNASLQNWLNAMLSYYTGLSGVQPYTLPTDANAREMAITGATSPYVLAFLAHKVVFEPACGQNPRPPLRLQEFPATPGQPLAAQALTLHVEPAALATHNHWLLAATVPTDRPYTLIVPVGDVTQAAGIVANQRLQSARQLITMPAVAANTAEVRVNRLRALIALPGETTADLARRARQRLGEFLRHNELTGFDVAIAGRPYFLESKRDVGAVEYHALRPGETVFDVAQQYGMRQKAIYKKNRLARVEQLRPGRVLWLQHTRPRETAIEYRALTEGEALERPSPATLAAEKETDALVTTANETLAVPRAVATESGSVKVKVKIKSEDGKTKSKRTITEDADGWGETLATAAASSSSPAAPAPVAVPVTAAPPVRPAPVPMVVAPAPLPIPVVPAPAATAPVAAAPRAVYLPPPAAAPAPAPLADEPAPVEFTAPDPAPVSAPARPAVVARPVPVPTPVKVVPVPAVPPAAAIVPAAPPVAVAQPASLPAFRPTGLETTHVVEPRESVYSIGRRYNIPPATLIALNSLTPPAGLTVGQVLVLRAAAPQPTVAAPAPAPKPASSPAGRANPALYVPKNAAPAALAAPGVPTAVVLHTVAAGETLFSISRRYQVKVADLQAWNGKDATDTSAKIGEVLRVSAGPK